VSDGGKFSKKIDEQEVLVCRAITTSRWTFILDNSGKIIYIDTEVDFNNDNQKVIDFLTNNNK